MTGVKRLDTKATKKSAERGAVAAVFKNIVSSPKSANVIISPWQHSISSIGLRDGKSGIGWRWGLFTMLPVLGVRSILKTKAYMSIAITEAIANIGSRPLASCSFYHKLYTSTRGVQSKSQCQNVALLIRPAHWGSRAKCCFASPVCERAALSYSNHIDNLPYSLHNVGKLSFPQPLSTSSTLGAKVDIWSSWNINQKPLVGFHHSTAFLNRKLIARLVGLPYKCFSKMAKPNNGSLCRQNFHEDCEANINKQINMEMYASYVYMSMAYYFDREDVALKGFHKYFKKASDEEREHAEKFMQYQNRRGGRIVLQPVAKPTQDDWDSPLNAVNAALELEKTVNQTLLDLHGIASSRNDANLCDFLESNFLDEQVHAIKELSDFSTRLQRVGPGLGEHIFDQELQEKDD